MNRIVTNGPKQDSQRKAQFMFLFVFIHSNLLTVTMALYKQPYSLLLIKIFSHLFQGPGRHWLNSFGHILVLYIGIQTICNCLDNGSPAAAGRVPMRYVLWRFCLTDHFLTKLHASSLCPLLFSFPLLFFFVFAFPLMSFFRILPKYISVICYN